MHHNTPSQQLYTIVSALAKVSVSFSPFRLLMKVQMECLAQVIPKEKALVIKIPLICNL